MQRREVIALLASVSLAAALAKPLRGAAQQAGHIPRVGVLTPAETDATPVFDGFRQGLRDLGYVEGKSIILEFRFAKGNVDALSALAADLVRIPVDLISVDSSAALRAAFNATRTIPIVMGAASDPVALGFAASIRRPGGNVTGMTIRADALSSKRMQLIKQAFPAIASVAVLMNPKNTSAPLSLNAAKEAAGLLGLHIVELAATTPSELHALRATDFAGADALVVLPDAMFWNHRATVVALAQAANRPAIYPEREYADDGGLIAYGPNIPDSFRRAAGYVDRILRGANPGELPIDEPAKFDFVINVRSARSLGPAISADFLSAANEVIE